MRPPLKLCKEPTKLSKIYCKSLLNKVTQTYPHTQIATTIQDSPSHLPTAFGLWLIDDARIGH